MRYFGKKMHVFYCLRCGCGWVSHVIEFLCPLCKRYDLFIGLVTWPTEEGAAEDIGQQWMEAQ